MATLRSDTGGYDYQFVNAPSDMFLCKICHLPSKKPHLSICCGHTFCKSCLDGIKTKGSLFHPATACPMCRSEAFTTVPNKQNERAIKAFVYFVLRRIKGVTGRVK